LCLRRPNPQNKRHLETRTLEIRHADAMHTYIQLDAALLLQGGVLSVVLDYELAVDVQHRTVVGDKREIVTAGFGHPEAAGVVDGEPLETLGHAGEAVRKILRRHVKVRSVNRAHGLQLAEVGKHQGVVIKMVDLALESGSGHHRGAELVE